METLLLDGKVILRPRDTGKFDELILMDGEDCIVHAEMMDSGCLWIGIYPRGETKRRVDMWIRVKGRNLQVRVEED
jgi:hypothetical protein